MRVISDIAGVLEALYSAWTAGLTGGREMW